MREKRTSINYLVCGRFTAITISEYGWLSFHSRWFIITQSFPNLSGLQLNNSLRFPSKHFLRNLRIGNILNLQKICGLQGHLFMQRALHISPTTVELPLLCMVNEKTVKHFVFFVLCIRLGKQLNEKKLTATLSRSWLQQWWERWPELQQPGMLWGWKQPQWYSMQWRGIGIACSKENDMLCWTSIGEQPFDNNETTQQLHLKMCIVKLAIQSKQNPLQEMLNQTLKMYF